MFTNTYMYAIVQPFM